MKKKFYVLRGEFIPKMPMLSNLLILARFWAEIFRVGGFAKGLQYLECSMSPQ